MMDWLSALFDVEGFGWRDALDILLVALLVYGAIALVRRTRGAPVALGIFGFLILWRLVVALELQTLGTILDIAVAGLPLIIVLLFQNHIRRALQAIGRIPMLRFMTASEDEQVVQALSLAALTLSSQRIGALIAIERGVGLRTYVDGGIPLDAKVSYELLLALFHTKSPLHDGAVIVSGGRIAAASCLLPLSTKARLAGKQGSRHRAALGLSEETDAFVIVVSEERGTISVARDVELVTREGSELRDELTRELVHAGRRTQPLPPRPPRQRGATVLPRAPADPVA